MNSIRTEVMTVTPLLAAKWLDNNNTKNRNLSEARVDLIAKDIVSGRWQLNHQGIAFYDTGTLADGQHRLAAIVRSNTPIDVMVTTGLPVISGVGIDNHRARSAADIIRVSGLSDWIGLPEVQIIKGIYQFSNKTTKPMAPAELVALGESEKESIMFGASAIKGKKRFVTSTPVKVAIAMASKYEDKAVLKEFSEVIVSGMPKKKADSIIIALRENLINDPLSSGAGLSGSKQVCFKTMRAIKAYCTGEDLKRIHSQSEMIYKFDSFSRA